MTEFDYRIHYNQFRVLPHAVDSLNVKHELQYKKDKAILCHSDTSKQYFPCGLPLENRVLLFARIKAKVKG